MLLAGKLLLQMQKSCLEEHSRLAKLSRRPSPNGLRRRLRRTRIAEAKSVAINQLFAFAMRETRNSVRFGLPSLLLKTPIEL